MRVFAYAQYAQTQLNPRCSSIHKQNNRIQARCIRQPVAVHLLELGLIFAYAINAKLRVSC